MSLTARELELVAQELRQLLGGFVQKVSVTAPRTVYLELRQPGASHLLLVCAEQGLTRLHRAGSRPPSPEPPHAFQGLLRAELTGMALTAIEVIRGERLVRLRWSGKEWTRELVAELTGRHGNLFLLGDGGSIRGSAVPNLSQKRDNRPGQPYAPPLGRAAIPQGDQTSRFVPGAGAFSLSEQIEQAYAGREARDQAEERRKAITSALKTRLQRLARTIEKVRGDVERTDRAEEHRRRGELLKTNLGKIQRGTSEVRLVEYTEEGPREVAVALDPARGPRENLERAFHQYRRLLAGAVRAQARLAQLEAERAEVEARLAQVAVQSDEEILRQASPAPSRPAAPGRRSVAPARPFREHLSPSGQRIRVGRGARENDALTFRHSKGNDVWLHARGVPGAHVVIPLERDEVLKDETLRDAALLAAHHSDARGDAVDVAWTRVKYVRKQKGAPGAVTFSQDKSVLVRPDPERLARLALVGDTA